MAFSKLGLSGPIVHAVNKQNFTEPTEIQAQTIPALLKGGDVMGVAQTGGGKTAAFLLPLIEKLLADKTQTSPGKPNAIILAPTRELAIQISKAATDFCRGLGIYSTVIYGGAPYRTQLADLKRGVHIVVATPGRLMDHVQRKSIRFDNVQTFILDEADRMLDMGFVDDVKDISSQLHPGHQTVMFSATMHKNIKTLSKSLLKDPTLVEVSTEGTVADTIAHRVMTINHTKKREALNYLLNEEQMYKALIFTRTKRVADKLAQEMRGEGMKVDSIHGDRQQRVRERILKGFKGEKIQYLVATDVAARGIDISDITHVINYDMPLEAEAYVHRVGRTGRAGRKGTAISFCATDESNLLRDVEKTIGESLLIDTDHPLHEEMKSKFRGKPQGGQRGRGNGGGRKFGGQRSGGGRGNGGRKDFGQKRSWGEKSERSNENRSEGRTFSNNGEKRSFGGNRDRNNSNGEKRSWGNKSEGRSFSRDRNSSNGEKRTWGGNRDGNSNGNRSFGGNRNSEANGNRSEGRSWGNKSEGGNREGGYKRGGSSEGRKFGGKPAGGRKFGGNSEGRKFGGNSEGRKFEGRPSRDGNSEGRKFGGKPSGGKSFAKSGKPTGNRKFGGNTGFKGKPSGNKPFRGSASR